MRRENSPLDKSRTSILGYTARSSNSDRLLAGKASRISGSLNSDGAATASTARAMSDGWTKRRAAFIRLKPRSYSRFRQFLISLYESFRAIQPASPHASRTMFPLGTRSCCVPSPGLALDRKHGESSPSEKGTPTCPSLSFSPSSVPPPLWRLASSRCEWPMTSMTASSPKSKSFFCLRIPASAEAGRIHAHKPRRCLCTESSALPWSTGLLLMDSYLGGGQPINLVALKANRLGWRP